MALDWKNKRLGVEMVDAGRFMASRNKAQALVLDELEALDGGVRKVRVDYWRRIVEERAND